VCARGGLRPGTAGTGRDFFHVDCAVILRRLYRSVRPGHLLADGIRQPWAGRYVAASSLNSSSAGSSRPWRRTSCSAAPRLITTPRSGSSRSLRCQHALREPEFSERIGKFRTDITTAAYLQISALVPDAGLARWAALLAPAVAIEAVITWLDAGQPDPAQAAARVRQAIMGVIGAAVAPTVDCSFPLPPNTPLP
jgi:hypothetical protein